MRRLLLLALTVALSWSPSALACGDKFLIIGRGAGYRTRYVAIHPASILLLGATAAGNGDVDVRQILQRAGHRVDYEPDAGRIDTALRSKPYDFVIVPLDSVSQTESRVQSLAPGALVVPIIFASTEQEVKQVEKQYECIAHSEEKQRNFLAVLDDAMSMRLKGTPMHCRWAAK
jgi:protein-L-isoaspartate O-methyltransferase